MYIFNLLLTFAFNSHITKKSLTIIIKKTYKHPFTLICLSYSQVIYNIINSYCIIWKCGL